LPAFTAFAADSQPAMLPVYFLLFSPLALIISFIIAELRCRLMMSPIFRFQLSAIAIAAAAAAARFSSSSYAIYFHFADIFFG
jgi:hypothetical protein